MMNLETLSMQILEIKDLKKHYKSPDKTINQVIDIPEFTMQAGEQIALIGGSGTGKSTFLNLIAGIVKESSGQIIVNREKITGRSEFHRDWIRSRSIGYIFQTFNLLPTFTALENVLVPMMFKFMSNKTFAKLLLEEVGLGDRMKYKPSQLSIGQQQRVAIARALANRPKLVLADEPTGNLDPANAQKALKVIRDLCERNNAALLLVSHDMAIVDKFDKVIDLKDINQASKSGIEV